MEKSKCRIKLELIIHSRLKVETLQGIQILPNMEKNKKNWVSKMEEGKRFKVISLGKISETGNRSKFIHVHRAWEIILPQLILH